MNEIEVTEMNMKQNTYFIMLKVTVSEKYSIEMKNDDNWPSGVEIRRYFFPKPKVEVESAELIPKARSESDGRLLKSC